MIYSLFEGRHDLPQNLGAICTSFDFTTKEVVKSQFWDEAVKTPKLTLIVTGLTPALTEFIFARMKHILAKEYMRAEDAYMYSVESYEHAQCSYETTLLHYDNTSKEYWEQKVTF